MDVFSYAPVTGEYQGSLQTDVSPQEPDAVLIPAHATPIAPPERHPSTCPVFDPAAQTWTLVPDYRGHSAWSTTTGQAVAVAELGKTLAELGLTDQPPPAGPVTWDGTAWQPDAAAIKAAHNAAVLADIAAIEAQTIRPLRDIILGNGDVVSGDDKKTPRERLVSCEARMSDLRAQLIK